MTRDLSIKEVADRIGISPDYVRRHLVLFPGAYYIGNRIRIPIEGLDKFRRARQREASARAKHK